MNKMLSRAIAEMVAALCSHANDGAPAVRRQITESLVDIGRKQPNLALSACLDFLRRNPKVRPCSVLCTAVTRHVHGRGSYAAGLTLP
jgi:hypothetical protein